jgi:hypothetical protein
MFKVYFVLEFNKNKIQKIDKMFFRPTYPNFLAFEAENRTIIFFGLRYSENISSAIVGTHEFSFCYTSIQPG